MKQAIPVNRAGPPSHEVFQSFSINRAENSLFAYVQVTINTI